MNLASFNNYHLGKSPGSSEKFVCAAGGISTIPEDKVLLCHGPERDHFDDLRQTLSLCLQGEEIWSWPGRQTFFHQVRQAPGQKSKSAPRAYNSPANVPKKFDETF